MLHLSGQQPDADVHEERMHFASKSLDRDVVIDVFLPPGYAHSGEKCRLLLFNDGQDMKAVHMLHTLRHLYHTQKLRPVVVVALHTNHDRIREYGTSRQPDYKRRGDKAEQYRAFVADELMPFLRERYRLIEAPECTAFAGFSLGGLSALDIAWSHPEIFGMAGIFSGALWWRWDDVRDEDPDASRIMHDIIRTSPTREGMRFWFQCGTRDEEEDRNNNGIIDAIDDTLDLIGELKNHGYRHDETCIRYLEVPDGEHNHQTWSAVLPDFLCWAFGGEEILERMD